MKLKCNLCGETFDEEEFEVENTNSEITVMCPNTCNVGTICVKDFCDVKED